MSGGSPKSRMSHMMLTPTVTQISAVTAHPVKPKRT
jgi:hypothetical protein